MPPLLNLLVALSLGALVHLCAMAVAADAFKVTVRKVVFGWGPVLFSLGRWTLKALPLGGMVKLRDTREEPEPDGSDAAPADAMNTRSRFVQAAIPLCGPLALALLAIALRGTDGLWSVGAGFVQILQGAFDHDVAHELLDKLRAATQRGLLPLLAITAAKMAAFNLLPLPALNGGHALLLLILGPSTTTPPWLTRVQVAGVWLAVFLALLWLAAIATYL